MPNTETIPTVSLQCPNCGAPVQSLDQCNYCRSAFSEILPRDQNNINSEHPAIIPLVCLVGIVVIGSQTLCFIANPSMRTPEMQILMELGVIGIMTTATILVAYGERAQEKRKRH